MYIVYSSTDSYILLSCSKFVRFSLYPSLFYQKCSLIWPMFIGQIGKIFTPGGGLKKSDINLTSIKVEAELGNKNYTLVYYWYNSIIIIVEVSKCQCSNIVEVLETISEPWQQVLQSSSFWTCLMAGRLPMRRWRAVLACQQ